MVSVHTSHPQQNQFNGHLALISRLSYFYKSSLETSSMIVYGKKGIVNDKDKYEWHGIIIFQNPRTKLHIINITNRWLWNLQNILLTKPRVYWLSRTFFSSVQAWARAFRTVSGAAKSGKPWPKLRGFTSSASWMNSTLGKNKIKDSVYGVL